METPCILFRYTKDRYRLSWRPTKKELAGEMTNIQNNIDYGVFKKKFEKLISNESPCKARVWV